MLNDEQRWNISTSLGWLIDSRFCFDDDLYLQNGFGEKSLHYFIRRMALFSEIKEVK